MTHPDLTCSYPRARDYINQVMKYFVGIQPSNPYLEISRTAWGHLSDVLDAAEEWERLNPGRDVQTQMEIGRREFWLKQAEKGIFNEEQLSAEGERVMNDYLSGLGKKKEMLEKLLPEDNQKENN